MPEAIPEAMSATKNTGLRLGVPQGVLLEKPSAGTPQTSEILFGERLRVEARDGDWVRATNLVDGHVGWLRADIPLVEAPVPTHRVHAVRSNIHPAPNFRAVPVGTLSLGSLVTVSRVEDGWCEIGKDAWIFAKHLRPAGDPVMEDPVETAARFLGCPYVWGGRSGFGIDCSGLVQVAMASVGIVPDHSSRMQREDDRLGPMISADGGGIEYRRGDIVFFPGHVGLMLDGTVLLHATVFTMSVTTEPLAVVAARAGGITGVRRPASRP